MINIKHLVYRIGAKRILDHLQLQVQQYGYFALAGENGAGKSTLIKIMLDLIRNTESGEITINGHDHKQIQTRRYLTYLPEKFDVKKEVTGWQYLKFVSGLYQQSLDKDRIQELCEQMALDYERLDHKTHQYSKGMKQKLGIISCFMLKTPLIILDEPLSGLDPKARFHFKQLLQQERQNNRTVFYSTHLLADAEEICDQFAILHRGKIAFNGTPQECMSHYQAETLEQAYMQCISAKETVQ